MNRLIRIVVISGLLIMLAIGLAFAERDAPTQTQLIGRWESTTPPSMITFTPDGIMYIEGNYGKFVMVNHPLHCASISARMRP